jgi:polyisoprenoid-binding protein YceI
MRLTTLCLLAFTPLPSLIQAQVPVFEIDKAASATKINFSVKSSVTVAGKFDDWNATLTMTSADPRTAVLDLKIQAASVDTGSGMKNGKLKGKDFFDVKNNPVISFKSTKVTPTGPRMFDVTGDFTIRGATKTETLKLHNAAPGESEGYIKGSMAFDRKDYGMNGSIPFVTIADRVEVDLNLKVKLISGPMPTVIDK